MTIKTLGMGVVKYLKTKAKKKALSEAAGWGAHLKRRSRVFKEGQERHKALDIKEGKKQEDTWQKKNLSTKALIKNSS